MKLSILFWKVFNRLVKADDPYERHWRELKEKSIGELLKIKFEIGHGNNYTQFMVDMELERRKFVRDVLIDRCMAGTALAISIIALTVKLSQCQFYQSKKANPTTSTNAPHIQANNWDSVLQPANTNKASTNSP
jgi:hypothetical protein